MFRVRFFQFLLLVMSVFNVQVNAQDYDLVIANGRVVDPETGLDGIRHLGINAGTIKSISFKPLMGVKTVNAKGLVVAPGFIDLVLIHI